MKCIIHPNRRSSAICSHCRGYFCQHCLTRLGHKLYCKSDYFTVIGGQQNYKVSKWESATGKISVRRTSNIDNFLHKLRNVLVLALLLGSIPISLFALEMGKVLFSRLLIVFCSLVVLASFFILVVLFLESLSSFLYVRKILKIKVSFSEAFYLRKLFTLSNRGFWFPCTTVLGLPERQKKPTIFTLEKMVRKELEGTIRGYLFFNFGPR